MGGSPEHVMLLDALERQEDLSRRGFTTTCGPTGSLVVDFLNHVRGFWDFHAGHYFWTEAGSTQPSYRADTIDKAVEYTLKICSAGVRPN